MDSIQFSFATIENLKEITQLFKNTILRSAQNYYSPEEINAWSKGAEITLNWKKRIQEHHFLLAHIDNTLVGMASIDKKGYIDVIYVSFDHQGKGIASQLLQRMEEKAIEQKNDKVTSDVSIIAKPFFIHKGYVVIKPQLVLCRGVVLRNYTVSKSLKQH